MSNKGKSHRLWSDTELRAATDAYLYMLQLELSRIPFSISEQSEMLISGPLYLRNEASVRYRMRNISFVMQEMGLPTLKAYSPAPQVGRNVIKKIETYLNNRGETLDNIRREQQKTVEPLSKPETSDVLHDLEEIKEN